MLYLWNRIRASHDHFVELAEIDDNSGCGDRLPFIELFRYDEGWRCPLRSVDAAENTALYELCDLFFDCFFIYLGYGVSSSMIWSCLLFESYR